MTTQILNLPTQDLGVQLTIKTSQDSEWLDSFAWTAQQTNNNVVTTTYLDLTGIAFGMNLRSSSGRIVTTLSTTAGTLVNGGTNGQLTFKLSASVMAGLLPDTYTGNIVATAGGHTRVVGKATITHAASD